MSHINMHPARNPDRHLPDIRINCGASIEGASFSRLRASNSECDNDLTGILLNPGILAQLVVVAWDLVRVALSKQNSAINLSMVADAVNGATSCCSECGNTTIRAFDGFSAIIRAILTHQSLRLERAAVIVRSDSQPVLELLCKEIAKDFKLQDDLSFSVLVANASAYSAVVMNAFVPIEKWSPQALHSLKPIRQAFEGKCGDLSWWRRVQTDFAVRYCRRLNDRKDTLRGEHAIARAELIELEDGTLSVRWRMSISEE